jgi:hypothetical protein
VLCVRKLSKCAWPVTTAAAIRLATVIRDMPLTGDQAVAVLDRMLHPLLAALDPEALPPYIYQLILFSTSAGSGGAAGTAAGPSAAGAGAAVTMGATAERKRLRARALRGIMDHCDAVDLEIGASRAALVCYCC